MVIALGRAVVLALGTFLVALGSISLARPQRVRRFLGAMAQSAPAHYAEMVARLVAGGALGTVAPATAAPTAFEAAGWVVVGTTVVLLAMPWRWHRRVARAVVPPVLPHVRWLGVGALLLAAMLAWGVLGK